MVPTIKGSPIDSYPITGPSLHVAQDEGGKEQLHLLCTRSGLFSGITPWEPARGPHLPISLVRKPRPREPECFPELPHSTGKDERLGCKLPDFPNIQKPLGAAGMELCLRGCSKPPVLAVGRA